MKKYFLAALMLIMSMTATYTAYANMDIVYDTKFAESVENELVWNDLSAVRTAEPDNCSFTVNIKYEFNTEKDYILYMQNGDESEQQIARIKLYPNKSSTTYTYKFPKMKYGNYNLKIRAAIDGETIGAWTETLSVMRMYQPQFLDQFSTAGVNGHVGRDENWAIEGMADLFLSAGIKLNRAGHTWYSVEGTNIPGVFQKSDVEKNDYHKFIEEFSDLGGRNLTLIQGMPECWFNGENSIWNSLPTTPKSIKGYSQFATKILEWYRDDIQSVEFLNEPNKPGANYPAAEYTNLVMRAGVNLVKSGYEGDRAAFSFYNYREKEWGFENYTSGIYPYMTAVSDHAYGFGSGPQCADKDVCEEVIKGQYDNVVDFGGWKDIDWTETGAPNTSAGTGLTEHYTVLKNIKDKLMSDKYNVIGYYLYDLINDGTVTTDRESMFGLVRHSDENRQPKLTYLAYANQNIETNGAYQIGRIDFGDMNDEIRGYIYIKDGEPLMIIWDKNIEDGIERQFEIPGETVELIDVYGNNAGEVSDIIQLHEEPWYVHGLSKSWLNKAVSYEVSLRNQTWKDNYSDILPEDIDENSVFDAAVEKLAGDITAEETKQILDSYRDLGLEIIEAGSDGLFEDIEVSRMLYQLYEPMIYIDRFYAGVYDGEKPLKLETDIEAAKQRADRMYKDDVYIMMYSDEILRHAKRLYNQADEVLRGTETNPMKPGIIKAWDMLSGYLVDWFNAFTEYEFRYNFGLISHIFVEADYHLETAYDGENKEIDFLVINEGKKPFNGTVQVLDESGEKLYETEKISVAPGAEIPVVLKFQILKLENQDTRTYTFNMVNEEGQMESNRRHIIEVRPMIEAQILDCNTTPENLQNIQLNIKNLFALKYDVNVKLSTSDNLILGTDTLNVSLAENEDKIVDIPVSEVKNTRFHHYTIKYEAYDSNGTKIVEDVVPLSFIPVTKASEPINPDEWDGDVSDWYDAYPIYRNYADDPNNPDEYNGANMTIRIMKKWDEENLYILADVYDKDHSSLNTGSNLWDGDCIQISIDTENNGSLTEGPSERYKDDDFEIGFGLTGAGEEFYQWRGPVANEPGNVEWAKIVRNNDIGYTRYLVALNKNNFNLKLSEGGTVTFNVAVNEADALGREFFYQITNGTADSKTPEWYYDFELVAPTDKEYVEHSSENIFPLK